MQLPLRLLLVMAPLLVLMLASLGAGEEKPAPPSDGIVSALSDPITAAKTLSVPSVRRNVVKVLRAMRNDSNRVVPGDCRAGDGTLYRGDVHVTSAGQACAPWPAWMQDRHKAAGLVQSFCRNPDASSLGPWCFTQAPKDASVPVVAWQRAPCTVEACSKEASQKRLEALSRCQRGTGTMYRGKESKTRGGLECRPWSAAMKEKYPSAGLESNLCRNPDGKAHGVWCNTGLLSRPWQYCHVPRCKVRREARSIRQEASHRQRAAKLGARILAKREQRAKVRAERKQQKQQSKKKEQQEEKAVRSGAAAGAQKQQEQEKKHKQEEEAKKKAQAQAKAEKKRKRKKEAKAKAKKEKKEQKQKRKAEEKKKAREKREAADKAATKKALKAQEKVVKAQEKAKRVAQKAASRVAGAGAGAGPAPAEQPKRGPTTSKDHRLDHKLNKAVRTQHRDQRTKIAAGPPTTEDEEEDEDEEEEEDSQEEGEGDNDDDDDDDVVDDEEVEDEDEDEEAAAEDSKRSTERGATEAVAL